MTYADSDLSTGEPERQGPLTFGQIAQLMEYEEILTKAPDAAWTRTLTQRWPVPESTPTAAVRAALALLSRRHEIIRTTFGRDGSGNPVQVVWRAGSERIRTVEPEASPTSDAWVDSYLAALRQKPLPCDTEPPISFEIVVDGASAKEVLIVFHHIVADHQSVQILRRDFLSALNSLRHGKAEPASPSPRQPIDEALIQEARANAENDGLESWREVLDVTAPTQYPVWDEGRSAGYTATFESADLQHAVSALSKRHGLWPAQALLGLYAFAMARYTDLPTASMCVISSNRFAYPSAVHCCALRVPVSIPSDAGRPEEIMKTVEASTKNLHRNADHDARALRKLLDERQQSTGFNTRFRMEYNFLSRRGGSVDRGMPRDARARSEFRHEPTDPADPTLTYFAARPGRGREPLVISFESNEAFLPVPAAEALLRAMESLGAALAQVGPDAQRQVGQGAAPWAVHMADALEARPQATGLVPFGTGYVDTARTVRAIEVELGGKRAVEVLVHDRGTPRERLVARLSEAPGADEVSDLLAALRRRADQDPALVMPTEVM
ncbi:condensation domain-containing protein [Kitasatospora sp. NPDC058218]|uniref:condensation domain-containing protein n=1 Tax=Kitasatospora sp. NPDC058218 TaxID=3346385 RepID=UPI0036DF804C